MVQEADGKDKWFQERWSKFTASENYKLLGNDSKNLFSAGGISYIEQKMLEMRTVMWERPELEEAKSLLHGKMYEYPCYKAYIEATRNYSMKYLGTETPLFLDDEQITGESGGSPDIINLDSGEKVDAGAEMKCPKNPMNHFKRLKWKDQWDIRQNYMSCYCQIQNLIKITGASIWQFISFDERMVRKKDQIIIIDVFPDKKFIDNLHFRIVKAVEMKHKMLLDYDRS